MWRYCEKNSDVIWYCESQCERNSSHIMTHIVRRLWVNCEWRWIPLLTLFTNDKQHHFCLRIGGDASVCPSGKCQIHSAGIFLDLVFGRFFVISNSMCEYGAEQGKKRRRSSITTSSYSWTLISFIIDEQHYFCLRIDGDASVRPSGKCQRHSDAIFCF